MLVYRDMTFCSNKDCPNRKCRLHLCNVPENLPEDLGVAISDYSGRQKQCPKKLIWEYAKQLEAYCYERYATDAQQGK